MEPHLKDASLVRVLRDDERPPVSISALFF
jgi:hypothetical protein